MGQISGAKATFPWPELSHRAPQRFKGTEKGCLAYAQDEDYRGHLAKTWLNALFLRTFIRETLAGEGAGLQKTLVLALTPPMVQQITTSSGPRFLINKVRVPTK